jgi:hypothetical protein
MPAEPARLYIRLPFSHSVASGAHTAAQFATRLNKIKRGDLDL